MFLADDQPTEQLMEKKLDHEEERLRMHTAMFEELSAKRIRKYLK